MTPITIYIDGNACPLKQEIYRVTERHALKGDLTRWSILSSRTDCRIKSGNDE
ncbi:MAG: hypothetical protein WAL80_09115 [Xanthobacteraceae bacterium]